MADQPRDGFWGPATYDFGHVQDDNGTFEADAETSHKTASYNQTESVSRTSAHLNADTDGVDLLFRVKLACAS